MFNRISNRENNALNSYYVGLAGFNKFRKNKLEDVLPLYLKKPQAQRQLEEKSKSIKIMYSRVYFKSFVMIRAFLS